MGNNSVNNVMCYMLTELLPLLGIYFLVGEKLSVPPMSGFGSPLIPTGVM